MVPSRGLTLCPKHSDSEHIKYIAKLYARCPHIIFSSLNPRNCLWRKPRKLESLKFLSTSENRHSLKKDFVNKSCVNMRLEGRHHSLTLI